MPSGMGRGLRCLIGRWLCRSRLPCYNSLMHNRIKERLIEIENELAGLHHPLDSDIQWLMGVASALLAVCELSSVPVEPDIPDIEDFDS